MSATNDTSRSERINLAFWREGNYVADYASRILNPAETTILLRYREPLSKRVLELGCGAGRVLGYLIVLGGEVHGIDVSAAMVDYCREKYPEAHTEVGDLRSLPSAVSGHFDAIFAPDNVLDVLDEEARRRVLAELRQIVAPDGLLMFASHNLASVSTDGRGTYSGGLRLRPLLDRSLLSLLRAGPTIVRRKRNRRRLAALQYHAGDHAVLNDIAHDYSLLHYYIRRDDQVAQLEAAGFELLDCLDLDGSTVNAGENGGSPSLYYIAKPKL